MDVKWPQKSSAIQAMIALFLAFGLAIAAIGCVSVQERQARQIRDQTYRISLVERVQSHVYAMKCASLLPFAADLLWEEGFEVELTGDPIDSAITDFRERDDTRRVRYEVHTQPVDSHQCAVQFVRHEELGTQTHRHRDPSRELTLLDRVDEDAARRARFEAHQEAQRAYEEARRDPDAEPTSW